MGREGGGFKVDGEGDLFSIKSSLNADVNSCTMDSSGNASVCHMTGLPMADTSIV